MNICGRLEMDKWICEHHIKMCGPRIELQQGGDKEFTFVYYSHCPRVVLESPGATCNLIHTKGGGYCIQRY